MSHRIRGIHSTLMGCHHEWFVVAFLLLLSLLLPGTAYAVQADTVQLYTERATTTATWSDDWFSQPSSSYNHDLATTGAILASAAYEQTRAVASLDALGFDSSTLEAYYPQETQDYDGVSDQVGYVFATKWLSDGSRPLVIVLVRGTSGAEEWESNFNVADTDRSASVHEGFGRAESRVLVALSNYLATWDIDAAQATFLVFGHSRGAAVANLLGYDLDRSALANPQKGGSSDGVKTFVYTYATPNVALATSASSCANVFNIVNAEDTICRMPLRAWGYGRYGKTLLLPSSSLTDSDTYAQLLDRMSLAFCELYGEAYEPYEDGAQTSKTFEDKLTELAPSVESYYEQDEQGISTASILHHLALFLGDEQYERSELTQLLGEVYVHHPDFVNALTQAFLSHPVSATAQTLQVKKAFVHAHAAESYTAWLQTIEESDFAQDETAAMAPGGAENPTTAEPDEPSQDASSKDLGEGISSTLVDLIGRLLKR